MSCHAAFTASGITACSPVQHARPVSRMPASCLASRRRPETVETPEPLDPLPPCPCCGDRVIHHRDLRAMEPTTRATSAAAPAERPVVTRHALRSPHSRNTTVAAGATHALHADRDESSEILIRLDPDPEAARCTETSLTVYSRRQRIDALLLPSSPLSPKEQNPP